MKKDKKGAYYIFYRFAYGFVTAFSAVILGLLSYYSFFYSHVFPEDYLEYTFVVRDSVVGHLLFFAVFFAVCVLAAEGYRRLSPGKKRLLTFAVMLLCLLAGCALLFDGSLYRPGGDPQRICQGADAFIRGDFSQLTGDGYFAMYPYQLGLSFFVELIYRMAGDNNNTVVIFINLLALVSVLYTGRQAAKELFDEDAGILCTLLCFAYIPVYFYIFFIYGECLSVAFSFLCIWKTTCYLKRHRKTDMMLGVVAGLLAVCLRMNSLIVLIAVGIVCILEFLRSKNKKDLLFLVTLVLVVFLGRRLVIAQYELRSGYRMDEGMPASVWISMGMQESARGNGWYSDYAVEVYREAGCSAGEADRRAKRDIADRWKTFMSDRQGMVSFYREKILSQWDEPTAEAFLVLNSCVDGAQKSGLMMWILHGKGYRILHGIMMHMQAFLYAMAFFHTVLSFWKKRPFRDTVFQLVLIGGFLFQILWEAKARYVLFYMMLMMPLAAGGIADLKRLPAAVVRRKRIR